MSVINELITKEWIPLSSVKQIPKNTVGIYVIAAKNNILYVGQSCKCIRWRLEHCLLKGHSKHTLREKLKDKPSIFDELKLKYVEIENDEKKIKHVEHAIIGLLNPSYND